jgi:Tat protein secretion system quality control protein TatD with DNase activity
MISPLDQALFGRLLDRVDYVGEVGLDGSREGRPTLDTQMKVFEHILGQPRIANRFWPSILAAPRKQKILRSIPADRLVAETDGPFAKTGQRESQPGDVPGLVADLAAVWGRLPDEAADQIYSNMRAIATAAGVARSDK